MDFNLFTQISKIIGRQINNISKKIMRIIKMAAKPFVHLNKYVRTQVKAMTRPPAGQEDYVRLFGVYVSKRFLGLSVIGAVMAVSVISTVIYPWLEGRLWTPTILLNSQKMASYTGPARIKNEMGTVIYSGDVVNGKLTGSASQYDVNGELVYTGEFQNAAYTGYGSFYSDGVLRYEGSFSDSLYDGEGKLYDEKGALIYQGGFSKGLRSGKGIEYRPDTHTMSYYGDFVNDMREGNGISYEADGVTVKYRGGFVAGFYEGTGICYENGLMIYQGQFSQGLYEGSGTLYDERQNIIYQGEFSKGSRQGAGTVYDAVGSALYSGTFLDGNVNYMGYLGAAPEDISAAFGTPGYTATENSHRIMTFLNLGAAFLCVDAGEGMLTCDKVLVGTGEGFLNISRDTTEENLRDILGDRFSSLPLTLPDECAAAFRQLSLDVPDEGRVDKYLLSTYYIKVYYDSSGEYPVAVECGNY